MRPPNLADAFLFALRTYLLKNNFGKAVRETDVLLSDGGDPLRPDVSFIT